MRLPWDEWGDTDVMLGMAADLHDRLVCSCGCGQWEADAHDPDAKDRWVVDSTVCYVRRAIDGYVKTFEPPNDAVLSVRLVTDRAEADRSAYAEMLEAYPSLAAARQPDSQVAGPADDPDGDN